MLQRKVLVLNKSYQPISIVTLDKALKKVSTEYKDGTPKARIIDSDFNLFTWDEWIELEPIEGEDALRSVRRKYRVPEVILSTRYDKLPTKHKGVNYNRRTVYKRDNNTCQYCGEKKIGNELSMDHVVPRCQGGNTSWENIVVACTKCNAKKAGRTPFEAGMKLLRLPKKPMFSFYPGDIRVKSWEKFLGPSYWVQY